MCQVAPLSRHKVCVTIKVWPDRGNTSLCVFVCVCVNICIECVRECVKQRVFLKQAPKAMCVWVSLQAHCHGNTVNTVMTKQTQEIGQTGESTQTERALRGWICRCICAWWLLSQNQHHNTHNEIDIIALRLSFLNLTADIQKTKSHMRKQFWDSNSETLQSFYLPVVTTSVYYSIVMPLQLSTESLLVFIINSVFEGQILG